MHSLAPRPSSTARSRLSLQSLWLLGLFTLLLLALSGPARAQRGGEYQVTRATYGTSWQGMDVTQRVHQLAQQGGSFQVSNDLFGADPAPNQRKVLRVQIRGRDGRTQTAEFAESSWVSPSQLVDGYGGNGGYNPGGPGYGYLTIHRATYGDGYRQVDVTQRLRAYVYDGRLNVEASNDLAGTDPAPNRRKQLSVEYSVGNDGRIQRVTVGESDRLRLP